MLTPTELVTKAFWLNYKVPAEPGVYIIYCKADEKCYIGSSLFVYARLSGHRIQLKKKKHPNPHMQSAFNKYGLETFSFLVLELCRGATPDFLLERENHYLLQLDPKEVFNLVIPAVKGGGVGLKRSPAHCAAISKAQTGNKWRLGSTQSEEFKARLSARLKGKKQTPEQIANAAAGRKAAYLTNPLMSAGVKNGRAKLDDDAVREIRRLYATGEYPQTKLAGMFGIHQTGISEIIRRKKWAHVV